MDNYIYLSYCTKDENVLFRVLSLLKNEKYPLYLRNANENYEGKYAKYIEPIIKSRITILFITKNYLNDDFCQSDAIICQNNNIPIIVLLIDNVNTDELAIDRSLRLHPIIFNLTNDLKQFENGFGLHFNKFKAIIDQRFAPSKPSVGINRPTNFDVTPKKVTDDSINISNINNNVPIRIEIVNKNKIDINRLFDGEVTKIPNIHINCRYDANREASKFYTRTVDVPRYPVSKEAIDWSKTYAFYSPTKFTSEKIKDRSKGAHKDPDVNESDFRTITFNAEDKKFNCERRSYHGLYKVVFNASFNALVPRNPVGRTGLIGRGHLGRWGPNHAADSVVTRWKKYDNKKLVLDLVTGRPILQFVAIQRADTKEWAIPGGMRDPNEVIQQTLVREFAEEALSVELKFDKTNKVVVQENVTAKFREFFSNGVLIYKGYVDDPRNTDNAWMETVVYNFHDENDEFVGSLKLQSGSDAQKAQWMDLSSSLHLFASHSQFLNEVAKLRKAHW